MHLVERQTGGKQVLKAEPPGGLGTPLSLKTHETKKSDKQSWNMQGALRLLKSRIGVWAVKALRKMAGVAGSPLWLLRLLPMPYLIR